ncbi:PREDICTED: sodium/hydrogen exchanger 2-like [Priapulus caudatus]|uniref:Sodium/hydrogen exchanger n=1 Tax=Priapulus caudatus TaxID=37621 RepID=A0ABM1ERA4_PRICU|nr:PREDICTED: sodium/hydrogen exchanger 2-like [Priapulus caudatus]
MTGIQQQGRCNRAPITCLKAYSSSNDMQVLYHMFEAYTALTHANIVSGGSYHMLKRYTASNTMLNYVQVLYHMLKVLYHMFEGVRYHHVEAYPALTHATHVLYHMFEAYVEIGLTNIRAVDIIAGICSFVVVGLGGTLIGVIFGMLTGFVTRFTDHVRVIEPIYVFLMGYMSYLTAEMFHLSGIQWATFCGITMRQYVEANISQKSHTTVKYWLKMLSSCAETIIFMFLGLSTVTDDHHWDTVFVFATVGFCLVYRFMSVAIFTFAANKIRLNRLNWVEQFIMAYGGIRGGVAFCLVILLNEHMIPRAMKNMFTTATLAVVFSTIFVQGIP